METRHDQHESLTSRTHARSEGFPSPIIWILMLMVTVGLLNMSACGRLITRPTPTPIPPTGTPTPTSTPRLRQAPPTPRPYTPPPTPTPTATPTPLIYTVQQGDTLLGIAKRFGVSARALQDINGIVDPRRLQIGQPLIIPVGGEVKGTPTPTPTPIPLTVRGLYIYPTRMGDVWILGEVINDSGTHVEQVIVGGALLDDQARVVSTASTPVILTFLPKGERAPFALRFRDAPEHFASYQVDVMQALPGFLGAYYLDVQVENVKGESEGYHTYFLDGTVRNVGSEDAVGVTLIATLYDALGRVIGLRAGAPRHNVIPALSQTTFHMEIQLFGGPVDHYHITVLGRRMVTPAP